MASFEVDSVKLFQFTLFPDFAKLVKLECEALSSSDCDNLWIPKDQIGHSDNLAVEILIAHMFNSITSTLVAPEFAGVEFWVQKYEHGKGLAFHFDKDEEALVADGQMKHPQFSSVFYLTGDRTRQRQAPTVVIDQRFDTTLGCAVPDTPAACALCWPQQGNVLLFDGGLAHGVLESANMEDIRMTLLINWWSERPRGIPCINEACGETAKSLAGLPSQQPDIKQQLFATVGQASNAAVPLPCTTVPLKSWVQPVAVDEACEAAGVALRGPDATDVVSFQHPGMFLVPIEVSGGDDVDCAAALLPCDVDED